MLGKIEQIGTPLELYERPDNIFVAGFIGSPAMNFMDGKVEAINERRAKVALRLGPVLDIPLAQRVEVTGRVIVGVRPEHLRVAAPDDDGVVTGEASMLEMLGSDTFIHWCANDQTGIIRESGNYRLRKGQPVSFQIDPSLCHLFSEAGLRISIASQVSSGKA